VSWQGNLSEPALLQLIIETSNMNCTGTVLGTAQAQVLGGIAPYDFSWDNGATTASISGLDTGVYRLTVQDFNLCIVTDSAVIIQNTGVQVEILVTDSISCNMGSDGEPLSVLPEVSDLYLFMGDGRDTQSINGINEGLYSVEVTDIDGCKGNQSLTVQDPEPLSAAFTVTDALCFGSDDGSVILGAQGGTGIFRFYWNDNLVNGNEAENLRAGIYELMVVDAENCETDTLVPVGQPEKLNAMLDNRYTVYPFCPDWQNGALAVTVTGGIRDYEYIWTDFPGEKDSILSDIKEDSYALRIIDSHGCVLDTMFRMIALNSTCLGIPTAFTPNSDAANDFWDISYINEDGGEASFHEVYPNGVIQVYDRIGNLVYVAQVDARRPGTVRTLKDGHFRWIPIIISSN
jgi:gliding motility-associated-like protein